MNMEAFQQSWIKNSVPSITLDTTLWNLFLVKVYAIKGSGDYVKYLKFKYKSK